MQVSETDSPVESRLVTEATARPRRPRTRSGSREHAHGRRRWVPWLLGVTALAVTGAVVAAVSTAGARTSPTAQDQRRNPLAPTRHRVVYEVTGEGGKSPEITYATDGVNTTGKVDGVTLPWRKELDVTVGPGAAVAQVMAFNGQSSSISCSVSVDGHVVTERTAPGKYSSVSCSTIIK
ncbi:MmpS family transport accessory protein [Streptomyces sp. NPDC058960]|uniref:MmpS family transport accessory protein n=1 Tax=Streptomyces sp. NPDC058960 TaxID=3346679 RepID=UPI0036AB0310